MKDRDEKKCSREFIQAMDAVEKHGATARLPHWDRAKAVVSERQVLLMKQFAFGREIGVAEWIPSDEDRRSRDWEFSIFRDKHLDLLHRRISNFGWNIVLAHYRGVESFNVVWTNGRDEIKEESFRRLVPFMELATSDTNVSMGLTTEVYKHRKEEQA